MHFLPSLSPQEICPADSDGEIDSANASWHREVPATADFAASSMQRGAECKYLSRGQRLLRPNQILEPDIHAEHAYDLACLGADGCRHGNAESTGNL
jgi:hypothetical protein